MVIDGYRGIIMKLTSYTSAYEEEVIKLYSRVFSKSEGRSEGKAAGKLSADLLSTTKENDLCGFVALENEKVVGCILCSRLTFEQPHDDSPNAFMLSPVAVDKKSQGKGIGQQLIDFGINKLKQDGIELLVTYGDPYYYIKVGFNPVSTQIITPPYKLSMAEGWLAQSLSGRSVESMTGTIVCVPAFNNEAFW
jgi:predicted N-acetyltransferase YhbS